MKQIVIDASVAAKWFFREEGSEQAIKLLDEITSFFIPDLFIIEMDSIITKKVRKRELPAVEAVQKRKQVKMLPFTTVRYSEISRVSFELATSLPVTIYDAAYLATAIKKDSIFFTADKRMVNGLKNTAFGKYIESI